LLGQATAILQRRDRKLARVIARVGPCGLQPGRQPDHLTALVRSIVFQQLSGKAASTIFGRVVALLPGGIATPEPGAWLALSDQQLRAAGLSGQKVSYLRGLCEHVRAGALPLRDLEGMGDDAIVEAVTSVKGFGRWSAHMYLIFHLGRADVWPADDLGIRKALMRMDGGVELPRPAQIEGRAERWRPYRTVASWYLWRLLDVGMDDVGW
jgi:3-methyladenine DNA glycosylase/8-oxoguanine DNA glycosylase